MYRSYILFHYRLSYLYIEILSEKKIALFVQTINNELIMITSDS